MKDIDKITLGIKDDEFIRGKVPMTKEEVRIISICKMNLCSQSIVYDIGSGTGSVSIEIAKCSKNIRVYSIEINPDAIDLLNNNKQKFNCSNIEIIQALAPDGLNNLPVATHAFIGGTKGNIKPILDTLYKINQEMRIVINAISLESIAEITQIIKEYKTTDFDVTQISISKNNKIGNYNLMQANNPVYIFSFSFSKD